MLRVMFGMVTTSLSIGAFLIDIICAHIVFVAFGGDGGGGQKLKRCGGRNDRKHWEVSTSRLATIHCPPCNANLIFYAYLRRI
jgi:hypothetical protein